jgi:hypothetical protein
MQTPVASIETRGGRSARICGTPFLTATAAESGQTDTGGNLEDKTSREVLGVSPRTEPDLYLGLAFVY